MVEITGNIILKNHFQVNNASQIGLSYEQKLRDGKSSPLTKKNNKFNEILAHLLIFTYRHQDDPVNEPGWDKIERAWTQAWPRPGDGGLKQEGLPHRASFWRAGG